MKDTFIKFICLSTSIISVGLVGCSTNTQSQNTGIGVATGAVAGGLLGSIGGTGAAIGGAVVGGLLGGVVGHNMDSSDTTRVYTSMDNNPTNRPTTWRNPSNGYVYTVAPTSGRMVYRGYPNCRRFYATAIISGKKQKISGIACRRANGVWETVSSR